MAIHEVLAQAGVRCFPCGVSRKPDGTWAKWPLVPRGENWKAAAYRPHTDSNLDWSSNVVGVPIPPGVFVIDLDTYKGATRQSVEEALGCALPWDDALIQTTISGGQHYAFACDFAGRQPNLGKAETRAAGKGFICTGQGYTQHGSGVSRLGQPSKLPRLPAQAVTKLQPPPPPTAPQITTSPTGDVVEALKFIDPGCSYPDWYNILCAIRNYFENDYEGGLQIAHNWSAGEYWEGDEPTNYQPESVQPQWDRIKVHGGVNASTLFYRAIQSGWKPPKGFDTSSAFGAKAAPTETFNTLIESITSRGGDPRAVPDIVQEIQQAGCNPLQTALLAAELKAALKTAGIKDKTVNKHIDSLLVSEKAAPTGKYDKLDAENALVFLEKHYPNGKLIKSDSELYAYNGKVWELITREELNHQIAMELIQYRLQNSKINACADLVTKLAAPRERQMNKKAETVINFENGRFDVLSKQLTPHAKEDYSTVLMPYDYRPSARCDQWLAFLQDVMDADAERVALLQEWFGYLMMRNYKYHKIMLLLGASRSGKGTIGRVMAKIFGDANFTGGKISAFARDSFLNGLRHKTVLFIGDAAKKISSHIIHDVIENIKAISGNDAVGFERKYLSDVSDTLPTRITIAANSVPGLFDDSGALASRIMVLPLYKSYLGKEDLLLTDKLLSELPGIANWAIEGWYRLESQGCFTLPQVSIDEARQIQEAYSPLLKFLSTCAKYNPEDITPEEDVFEAYRGWALNHNEEMLRRRSLVNAIKDATRGRGVRYDTQRGFIGMGLSQVDYSSAFTPVVGVAK